MNWTNQIGEELRHFGTSRRDLRRFGLLVGAVFALLGLVFWLRHQPVYPWFLAPGLALIAAGALVPRLLKHVHAAWMTLAVILGIIVSTLLLTVFYFVVVTPIGLVARLAGKDFLRLKLNRRATSYWMTHSGPPRKPADYERQF